MKRLGLLALIVATIGCLGTSSAGTTTGSPECPPCPLNATCSKAGDFPSCHCYSGYTPCVADGGGFICANFQLDNDNCGACGTACPPAETCLGGFCQCHSTVIEIPDAGTFCGGTPNCDLCTPDSDELACCSSTCVDIQTDQWNCGRCFNSCTEYGHCDQGKCECPPDFLACQPDGGFGFECSDGQRDDYNCGACGNVCPSNAYCQSGVCICYEPAGFTACAMNDGGGAICADLASDPFNCGFCGNVCDSGVCLTDDAGNGECR